jgi:hypothetical protein
LTHPKTTAYNEQIKEKETYHDIGNYIKEQSGQTSTRTSNQEAELRAPQLTQVE